MSTDQRNAAPDHPHLALRREAAAAAIGVSPDHFDRFIRPHLPVVHVGRVRVYPTAELERFLADRAESPSQAVAA